MLGELGLLIEDGFIGKAVGAAQFQYGVFERDFAFGGPDNSLLALAADVLCFDWQIVAIELGLKLGFALLALAHELEVLVQANGLKVKIFSQTVHAQAVDKYLLGHFEVLSCFIILVLEPEEGRKSVLAFADEVVRLEEVFGVLAHELDLVFDLHDELGANGLEAALEHAEEVVASAGGAGESLNAEGEEEEEWESAAGLLLVHPQDLILHVHLSALCILALIEVCFGAAAYQVALVCDGLDLRRQPIFEICLLRIVDL